MWTFPSTGEVCDKIVSSKFWYIEKEIVKIFTEAKLRKPVMAAATLNAVFATLILCFCSSPTFADSSISLVYEELTECKSSNKSPHKIFFSQNFTYCMFYSVVATKVLLMARSIFNQTILVYNGTTLRPSPYFWSYWKSSCTSEGNIFTCLVRGTHTSLK